MECGCHVYFKSMCLARSLGVNFSFMNGTHAHVVPLYYLLDDCILVAAVENGKSFCTATFHTLSLYLPLLLNSAFGVNYGFYSMSFLYSLWVVYYISR